MSVAVDQFRYVQQLVLQRCAIVLDEGKDYLVESRLAPLARALGLPDANGVVQQLRARRDPRLEQQVLDAMTTNETSWFRDRRPFDALSRVVLPDVLTHNSASRQLRIWSAAASSGQELYSVAILLAESLPQLRTGWNVELVGTDFSAEMVRRATEGLYSTIEVNRGLPAAMLVRYFDREGASWRVNAALRARTRFNRLNLVEPWPSLPNFDVVLLRNVLIYFDSATKRRVLCRVVQQLAPGGYLLLGAAESPSGLCDDLEPVLAEGTVVYRVKRG